MNAIKVEATVDEAVVRAIPALLPLLGRQVELIALDAAPGPTPEHKLTADELLASRIKAPPGVGPIFQKEEMEQAIAESELATTKLGAPKVAITRDGIDRDLVR